MQGEFGYFHPLSVSHEMSSIGAESFPIFNNLIFTEKPHELINIDTAIQQIKGQPKEHRDRCGWIDQFIENIRNPENVIPDIDVHTYYLFYRDNIEHRIIWIGAVTFEKTIKIFNYDFYYISIRCAFKTSIHLENSFYSSGRLLWIYILYQINVLNDSRPFVIYNTSTHAAYGYHKKMGMKPLSQTFHNVNQKIIIIRKLSLVHDYRIANIAFEYFYDGHDKPEGLRHGHLFFRSDDKYIDYSSPSKIYFSMPITFYRSLYNGGKKYRKRKPKSKSRKKNRIKKTKLSRKNKKNISKKKNKKHI